MTSDPFCMYALISAATPRFPERVEIFRMGRFGGTRGLRRYNRIPATTQTTPKSPREVRNDSEVLSDIVSVVDIYFRAMWCWNLNQIPFFEYFFLALCLMASIPYSNF